MKGHVAAAAVAFASLAREGVELPGDVVLAIVADEEVGRTSGCRGSHARSPDLVRAEFAVNEGAGERCALGGRRVLPLLGRGEDDRAVHDPRAGPKRPRSGPLPRRTMRSSRSARARGARSSRAAEDAHPGGRRVPRGRSRRGPSGRARARAARALHPLAAALVEPLLSATLSPTMIEASTCATSFPGLHARRRLPAATRADDGRDGVDPSCRDPRRLGARMVDAELLGGSRSPSTRRCGGRSRSWVEGVEPGAQARPDLRLRLHRQPLPSRVARTCAYGFFPLKAMPRSWRRPSCTLPTSGSRSTISSSVSTCSATSQRSLGLSRARVRRAC